MKHPALNQMGGLHAIHIGCRLGDANVGVLAHR